MFDRAGIYEGVFEASAERNGQTVYCKQGTKDMSDLDPWMAISQDISITPDSHSLQSLFAHTIMNLICSSVTVTVSQPQSDLKCLNLQLLIQFLHLTTLVKQTDKHLFGSRYLIIMCTRMYSSFF